MEGGRGNSPTRMTSLSEQNSVIRLNKDSFNAGVLDGGLYTGRLHIKGSEAYGNGIRQGLDKKISHDGLQDIDAQTMLCG